MVDVLAHIKELREDRGWSVYKLAQLSGIPQSSIATWYQKNYYPPIDKLERLCSTFGITLSEFFRAGEEPAFLTPEQTSLLAKWNHLDDAEKSAVLHILDTFTR